MPLGRRSLVVALIAASIWFGAVRPPQASAAEAPASRADKGVVAAGERGRRLVEFVREAGESVGFSGAVLAAEKGEVLAAVAVGESDGKPLTTTALFELASCTKPFTAIAVLKLAEEGRLALDDPIAKHLPGIPADCQAITIRHLLQHTSGIPGSNYEGRGTDLAEVIPKFLAGGPQATPGERHEYWNQGYALVSEVIARASGKPYTEYLREAVFRPCKMTTACFNGDAPPQGALVAIGASMRGAARSALEHPYGEYGFQYRGMGGLVASLVDLWHWDRTLARGQLLSAESIAEMTRPGPGGYALGWRIATLENGRTVHEHTGSVRGFLASIRRDPEADGCLFVLANSDDSQPFNAVCSGCEEILAGKQPKLEAAAPSDGKLAPLDRKLIGELVGEYVDDKGRTLTVSREGRLVRAWIDWHGPITRGYLNDQSQETLAFCMRSSRNRTKFEKTNDLSVDRDAEGKVVSLTITDLKPPVRFSRVGEE